MMSHWGVFKLGEEIHVAPVVAGAKGVPFSENVGGHQASTACWCQPRTEQHERLLVIHNAFEN